jgi:hypothetical protein
MFTIQWSISSGIYEAATATPKAAWEIYWALKKSYRKDRTPEDYWIRISLNSIPLNPEKGSALPPCKPGEGPTFILKKGEDNE